MSSITPKFLDGWRKLDDFARDDVKRHPKTVKRWTEQPNGLPFATLGNMTIIHVETARTWLLGRMHRPNTRRNSEHTR